MKWLIQRIFQILIYPKREWQNVKQEQLSTANIFLRYLLVLEILSAIFQLLGRVVFGEPVPGMGTFLNSTLFVSVVTFVLVGGVFFNAYIVNIFAPVFNGKKNYNSAFKLVVFSYTPIYLSKIFNITRFMKPISIVIAVYSLYLFYLGLPILMICPKEKAGIYTFVSILVFLLSYIIGALTITIFLI